MTPIRSRAAAVGMAAAIVLAASSSAAAQGPPPPGTPPPPGAPSGGPPPAPVPETPGTDQGPAPSPQPPAGEAPRTAVELAADTLDLRGRRVTVPLRCAASGRVTLRHRRMRVGRVSFGCENGVATAELRMRARVARRLKLKPRRRLVVVAEVAGTRVEDRVTLRTRPAARASAAVDIAGTAMAQCGSRYSYGAPGFSVVPPAFFSRTGSPDWMYYRVFRWWHGWGPERVAGDLDYGWNGPYYAPAGTGATYIPRYTIDFVDDYRGWYIAAGFEVYSASTGTSEFRWGPMGEVLGGFPVYGAWCHPV